MHCVDVSVAAEDGGEPVPVSFRYNVAPLASMKAFVFKPNQPEGNTESVKSANLGGYFAGSFQKLIRNSRASVVWEAGCINFEKYCVYFCILLYLPPASFPYLEDHPIYSKRLEILTNRDYPQVLTLEWYFTG